MPWLPEDHLERVYAGTLGKVIGVYLGRPFEGFSRDRILSELAPIRYFVNHKNDHPLFPKGVRPLVVTDDDVSATFVYVRALEEHGAHVVTSEEVGKTWLNNTIEDRSILWWGGKGISTEHTAYLNLKRGVPGGKSGSIEINGKAVAEQIGGEIFIDGFALCAPANPDLAVQLAKSAASVSHDGESVYGAMMWAAMEAEGFLSKDIDHLLDTGLRYIPKDCIISQSVSDIRAWVKEDGNREKTRDRVEEKYGNDKFPGFCHVVPNHSIKILSLIYGGHSFHEAMHIIMMCGWDTDSNGGNMGALLGLMHGLQGFDPTTGPDWRGPIADRALISSADGGYSINNCARIAYDLTNSGRKLAGLAPLEAPKGGAQYHFTLPGSVQGFQAPLSPWMPNVVCIEQAESDNGPALAIRLNNFSIGNDPVEVLTDTFMPSVFLASGHYILQASPLVYPGQKVRAKLHADSSNTAERAVTVALRLKINNYEVDLTTFDGSSCSLKPGDSSDLEFEIPDTFNSQPIQKIGVVVSTASVQPIRGTLWLDSLGWTGAPRTSFRCPKGLWPPPQVAAWRRAWVNNASTFPWYTPNFCISKSQGQGGIFIGCRDWCDYRVAANRLTSFTLSGNGLAVRVQGLTRWYALLIEAERIVLVKALDEKRIVLASKAYKWDPAVPETLAVEARGKNIRGYVADKLSVEAEDDQFMSGGIGLIVTDGSLMTDQIDVEPLDS